MSRFEQLCILALALAGGAMYLFRERLEFTEFLLLWLVILVAIHAGIAIWRRWVRREAP